MRVPRSVSDRNGWTSFSNSINVYRVFDGPQETSVFDEYPATSAVGYDFAIEDLAEIAAETDWGEDVAPSTETIGFASFVLHEVSSVYRAPEVTVRENGTILLLWHDSRGFLSIEVGTARFGLVSAMEGYPSVRINGDNANLGRQLPRRVNITSARPIVTSNRRGAPAIGTTESAPSPLMSDATRAVPFG